MSAGSHPTEIKKLLETIAEQRSACEQLLDVMAAERTAIIEGRIDELAWAVEHKESLAARLDRLERERRRLAASWMQAREAQPSGTGFKTSTGSAQLVEQVELARANDGLADVFAQAANLNRANAGLLQESLRVTRGLLNGLCNVASNGSGYSSGGQLQNVLRDSPTSINCQA